MIYRILGCKIKQRRILNHPVDLLSLHPPGQVLPPKLVKYTMLTFIFQGKVCTRNKIPINIQIV